ncbi:trafficking protein particle complex subunit 1-like [Hydractinia symbiolongicarpus]|uniref:trafficking protein particle complex subunit 1-like n=1 Tax=Hydractinia symbiolongicarpus TaxID=13093 RepID=UPI002549FB40|nr:trafficking protein particle complex subunit 1-like [Hydractinia symbiolongicarpus]
MTIFNLYIYDRNGTCLYYQDWQRKKSSNLSRDEEQKLMYGMLFSLKSFVTRMSPTDTKDCFVNYRTSTYKLNFFETPTGIKLILNTDLNVGKIDECLRTIYKIYVDYVVKNPLTELNEPIENEMFTSKLNNYVQNLPIYY